MDSKKRGVGSRVDVMDKIENRKIKNRESAILSRENKKREMMELQRSNALLSQEVEILKKMLCDAYGSNRGVENYITDTLSDRMNEISYTKPEVFEV